MRGGRPRPLAIPAADTPILEAVARSRRLAWFQVQHARIVLAVAAGQRVGDVASRLECDRATVWRICRRYEQGGLEKLLLDDPRLGRPQEISPPAARPDRRTGLPGAGRRGAARHPLVQRRLGQSGRC
jgi:Winged helix-turn helix